MAFCGKCGAQVEDGVAFCPSCGASMNGEPAAAPVTPEAAPVTPTAAPVVGDNFPAEDIEKGKVMAILGYIFQILFFLPLVTGDKTEYAKFHANQALLLLILSVLASLLAVIIIGWLLYIPWIVFTIMGIIASLNGSTKPLPLIGKIRIIK